MPARLEVWEVGEVPKLAHKVHQAVVEAEHGAVPSMHYSLVVVLAADQAAAEAGVR